MTQATEQPADLVAHLTVGLVEEWWEPAGCEPGTCDHCGAVVRPDTRVGVWQVTVGTTTRLWLACDRCHSALKEQARKETTQRDADA